MNSKQLLDKAIENHELTAAGKKVFEVMVFFKGVHRKYTIVARNDDHAVTYIQRKLSPEAPWRVFQESVKQLVGFPEGLHSLVWTAK